MGEAAGSVLSTEFHESGALARVVHAVVGFLVARSEKPNSQGSEQWVWGCERAVCPSTRACMSQTSNVMKSASSTFDQACTELREFAALVGCIHDHIDSLNQEAAQQLDALFLTRSEPLLRLLSSAHKTGGDVLDSVNACLAEMRANAWSEEEKTGAISALNDLLIAVSSAAKMCQQLNYMSVGVTHAIPDFTCLLIRVDEINSSLALFRRSPA
ncbi:MAG TPA: hypothetical protein VIN35_11705 [Hydrogenophaga sp.]